MELSEIINLVLGGGLVTAIIAVANLKSTVREAKANAEKATAEAETVRIDNTERATRVLIENIVEPLKQELDETRRAIESSKREMARLRKAIDTANSCKHHDDCPVLYRMRKQEGGGGIDGRDRPRPPRRQPRSGRAPDLDAADSSATGDADADDGQPP